jgi:hypothetical protein
MCLPIPCVNAYKQCKQLLHGLDWSMQCSTGFLWAVMTNAASIRAARAGMLTGADMCVAGAGRVDEQFEFRDPRNMLVGELGDDSQFEVRVGWNMSGSECAVGPHSVTAGTRPYNCSAHILWNTHARHKQAAVLCCHVLCCAGPDILRGDWALLCIGGGV